MLQLFENATKARFFSERDVAAYRTLTDKEVSRTAFVNAFGMQSIHDILVYTESEEDTMRQKKGLLRNVVDKYVDRWQVIHCPVPHI
jgi:hypothetical protein